MALCTSLVEPQTDKYGLEWLVKPDGHINYRTVVFRNCRFDFDVFSKGFADIAKQCWNNMQKINVQYNLKKFMLDGFYDDKSNAIPGYSFVSDPRNKILLLEQSKFKESFKRNIFPGRRQNYDSMKEFAKRHCIKMAEIVESLLFLIHVGGGGPARATELPTFSCVNDTNTPQRSVVLSYNSIAIVQKYKKSDMKTLNSRNIVRYQPLLVSQLITQYLVYIRPIHMLLLLIQYAARFCQ